MSSTPFLDNSVTPKLQSMQPIHSIDSKNTPVYTIDIYCYPVQFFQLVQLLYYIDYIVMCKQPYTSNTTSKRMLSFKNTDILYIIYKFLLLYIYI